MRLTTSLTLMYLLIAGMTPAQTVTETLSVPSLPLDVRSISVVAAQANEQSSFIVENSTSGGGTIDVLSPDSCAVISLVTPNFPIGTGAQGHNHNDLSDEPVAVGIHQALKTLLLP